jgi:hypothetical protein
MQFVHTIFGRPICGIPYIIFQIPAAIKRLAYQSKDIIADVFVKTLSLPPSDMSSKTDAIPHLFHSVQEVLVLVIQTHTVLKNRVLLGTLVAATPISSYQVPLVPSAIAEV